jgi:hypothetical protein
LAGRAVERRIGGEHLIERMRPKFDTSGWSCSARSSPPLPSPARQGREAACCPPPEARRSCAILATKHDDALATRLEQPFSSSEQRGEILGKPASKGWGRSARSLIDRRGRRPAMVALTWNTVPDKQAPGRWARRNRTWKDGWMIRARPGPPGSKQVR